MKSDLPLPPPPPPPDMPAPLTDNSYQYFLKGKHLAMLNGQPQFGSTKQEVENKYKQLYEKVEGEARQTEYAQAKINLTLYKHCVRCDRWILINEQKIHMECHAARVRDWLLLGDRLCSTSKKQLIERNSVKYIVNAANGLPNFLRNEDPQIQYINLDLDDSIVEDPIEQFKRGAQFLNKWHNNNVKNGKIFVHCNQGRSRSVSVILVYFLLYENIPIREGLEEIRLTRPIAKPNVNYMKRLLQLEEQVLKNKQ